MTDYFKLRKQLEKHPGWEIKLRREAHLRSIKIFSRNFSELASLIDKIENPDFYYKSINNKILDDHHSEIARLLFNYLSSAQSLVDHTRSYFKKWHGNDAVGKRYQTVIKDTFPDNPTSNMVKDLRNYMLHRGIPSSTIHESFNFEDNLPPVITITFKVITLKEWRKWTKGSKEYMRKQGHYVELRKLVKEYHNLVHSFYMWVDDILNESYKEEQSEMLKLLKEVIDLEKAHNN